MNYGTVDFSPRKTTMSTSEQGDLHFALSVAQRRLCARDIREKPTMRRRRKRKLRYLIISSKHCSNIEHVGGCLTHFSWVMRMLLNRCALLREEIMICPRQGNLINAKRIVFLRSREMKYWRAENSNRIRHLINAHETQPTRCTDTGSLVRFARFLDRQEVQLGEKDLTLTVCDVCTPFCYGDWVNSIVLVDRQHENKWVFFPFYIEELRGKTSTSEREGKADFMTCPLSVCWKKCSFKVWRWWLQIKSFRSQGSARSV